MCLLRGTDCAYSAVRTRCLYIINVHFRRWPVTAKDRFRSEVSPCKFWGGRSGTGTGFSSTISAISCQYHSTNAPHSSPLSVPFHQCSIRIFVYMVLLKMREGRTGEAWEPSKPSGNTEALDRQLHLFFFVLRGLPAYSLQRYCCLEL